MADDMGDLRRVVGKSKAVARCTRCEFRVRDVNPETAGARARKHARETGHVTEAVYVHTSEYRPVARA